MWICFCVVAVFLPVRLVNSCNFSLPLSATIRILFVAYLIRFAFVSTIVWIRCGRSIEFGDSLRFGLRAPCSVFLCIHEKKGHKNILLILFIFCIGFTFICAIYFCIFFFIFVCIYSFYFCSSNGKFYKWCWKTKTD